ncbi:MAG: hypothetical protein WDN49_00265 [Acetobacteraceae bacterium]
MLDSPHSGNTHPPDWRPAAPVGAGERVGCFRRRSVRQRAGPWRRADRGAFPAQLH